MLCVYAQPSPQPTSGPCLLQSRPPPTAGQCLEAIRRGDPAGAQGLYSIYANEVRACLRRRTGVDEVEDQVLSVLIQALRFVRELGPRSAEELSLTVCALTQRSAFAFNGASDGKETGYLTADLAREITNTIFTALDKSEREVLLRAMLLSEEDEDIAVELNLPVKSIGRTRAKARLLFRIAEVKLASVDQRLTSPENHPVHPVDDKVRTI